MWQPASALLPTPALRSGVTADWPLQGKHKYFHENCVPTAVRSYWIGRGAPYRLQYFICNFIQLWLPTALLAVAWNCREKFCILFWNKWGGIRWTKLLVTICIFPSHKDIFKESSTSAEPSLPPSLPLSLNKVGLRGKLSGGKRLDRPLGLAHSETNQ